MVSRIPTGMMLYIINISKYLIHDYYRFSIYNILNIYIEENKEKWVYLENIQPTDPTKLSLQSNLVEV